MKKQHLLRVLLMMFVGVLINSHAEVIPTIKWQKSFGGTGDDWIFGSVELPEGGYLLGGSIEVGIRTNSFPPYPTDYYLVKIDDSGNKQWERFYGGDGEDNLASLLRTSDGGYILGGQSTSGISGDKSTPYIGGGSDIWILKLDQNFNKVWDWSIGTTNRDWLQCLRETDNGYVLGGVTHSSEDYWVIRLNSNGDTLWNKHYGGTGSDVILDVQQTLDGGFILAGQSRSGISGNKTSPSLGGADGWMVKLNGNGNVQWDRSYGGATDESIDRVIETDEGSLVVCGRKRPFSFHSNNTWIFKIDQAANIEWDLLYDSAGPLFEGRKVTEMQSTPDGGYIVSSVYEEFPSPRDCQLFKIDAEGNRKWAKILGGNEEDYLLNVLQTSDHGFLLTGYSFSGESGNKTTPNFGGIDGWVLKLERRLFINRSGQDLTLSWSSISGEAYKIQYKTNLAEVAWTDLATVVASGATASRTESVGPGQRYYRIVGSE